MTTLESLGQVITADVLVIGHGAGGLVTAITAQEANPKLKVLAVDKASLGFGGKGNKGGGHCSFIPEGGDEKYVEYHTRNLGDYLNDQDLLLAYARSTREVLADLERWGVKLFGKEAPFNAHPMIPWKMVTVDLDFLVGLGHTAKKRGMEFMDKIAGVDLRADAEQALVVQRTWRRHCGCLSRGREDAQCRVRHVYQHCGRRSPHGVVRRGRPPVQQERREYHSVCSAVHEGEFESGHSGRSRSWGQSFAVHVLGSAERRRPHLRKSRGK